MSRANTHGLVMLTLVHLPIVSHLFSSHLYSRNSTLQELYLVYYMTQLLNIYCTPRFTIESTRISARATNWNWATCSLTRLLLSLSLSFSLFPVQYVLDGKDRMESEDRVPFPMLVIPKSQGMCRFMFVVHNTFMSLHR